MRSSLRKQLSVLVQRRLHIERRRCKRIVPVRRTLCIIRPADSEDRATAVVQNLSRTGLALQAEAGFASGSVLHLLLVNDAHTFSLAVDMSVVRSSRVGDLYMVAGPFARPLLHEEVVPFMI